MKTITVILMAVVLFSCSKNETSPNANMIYGKWHMAKYVDWRTENGQIFKDSATLDPLALFADFKPDSSVLYQERSGTVYLNTTQRYYISGNTLYVTNKYNSTGYDTCQILTLTSNELSYYRKRYQSGSSTTMTQTWEYWAK